MKFKILLLFFFLQLLIVKSYSQLWYLTRGISTDEVAWAVDADNSGNIYWAIEEKDQWPYWYYNIVLFKIDSNAQQVWQTNPWGNGTGFNDIAFKVTVTDSVIYLSGRSDSTASTVSGDALVIGYDIYNGSVLWNKCYDSYPDYGYEEIDGLVVEPDGIYFSGWKQQQIANDVDFLVSKIDFNGQLVWINTWDYNSLKKFDGANGHVAIDNNYIYLAGHVNRTNIASLDGDGVLVCFSRNDGSYQWHVTWGGALYDDALGLTISSDSMLYVTGYTGSFGNGSQNYLNKYTRTGQLLWSRIWGGSGTEDSRSLVTDGDSMIYVIGATSSYGSGMKDIFVLKYDTAGALLDSVFWGGTYDETAKDVVMYGDYLYITGETKSYGNGLINGDHKTDGLLLKINGRTMQVPDSTMTFEISALSVEHNDFRIFPNPFETNFSLSFYNRSLKEEYEVEVIDIYGRIVKKVIIIDHPQQIECSNLETGLYVVQVRKNNVVTGQKKIIKY